MARTVVTYTGASPTALQATVNAQLALLPGIILRSIQLLVPGDTRYLSNQVWACVITYDTGGTGTSPFVTLISSATEESLAAAASQTFITANPTYFYAPPQIVSWTGGGRGTPKFFSLLIYNTVASVGNTNYGIDDIGVVNVLGLTYTQAANTGATAVTGLNFTLATYQGMVVDYVLTRGAAVSKTGTLRVNGDSVTPVIVDDSQAAVSGAPGLTWTASIATGVVQVNLAVDNSTGTAIRAAFSVRQYITP